MKKLNLNKKGFTLVELLAVIVVLAVIMLLAVNAVIPQMNKARKNAFVTEAQTFIGGAETYVLNKQMGGAAVTDIDCVDLDDLMPEYVEEKEGYSGIVEISGLSDGNPVYTIYVTNGKYYINGKTSKDLAADESAIVTEGSSASLSKTTCS